MTAADIVVAAVYPNQTDAMLACTRLESAGIKGIISADNEGGMLRGLSLSGGGFRVLVSADDLEDALAILSE